MKCAIEVSLGRDDKRWPNILVSAGIKDIALDLNAFDPFRSLNVREPEIKGAVPGYRWRQKVYRKTERFFNLCAQYGVRTALKKACKSLLKPKNNLGNESSLSASVQTVANFYEENGLSVSLIQSPHITPEMRNVNFLSSDIIELVKDSIKICSKTRCTALSVQPLSTGIPKGDEWEANRLFFLELLPLARQHNIKILLENQTRMFNGRIVRGLLADPTQAIQWIDSLNSQTVVECFGLCLNLEALHQCRQDSTDYIQRLGHRLKAVRANFNLSARYAYRDLILGLRKISFDGTLALDARWLLQGVPDSTQSALLNVIAKTLAYLHMQVELEMKLRKYPEFVLFGTGLMFQNFMRNYGTLYPPIFVCDNNPDKWGREICGIRVYPPKKLRDLPEECAVFICNRFYEETENQLGRLGVQHVECFNDEILQY